MVDEVLQKFEDNTSLPMPSTLPSFREKRLQSSSYDNDKPHSLPYSPSVASEVATEKGASFSDGCQQHWSPAQSYLYMDKTNIDIVDNIDPDVIPPVDVASKLYKPHFASSIASLRINFGRTIARYIVALHWIPVPDGKLF
jgi:hypothetical protein